MLKVTAAHALRNRVSTSNLVLMRDRELKIDHALDGDLESTRDRVSDQSLQTIKDQSLRIIKDQSLQTIKDQSLRTIKD